MLSSWVVLTHLQLLLAPHSDVQGDRHQRHVAKAADECLGRSTSQVREVRPEHRNQYITQLVRRRLLGLSCVCVLVGQASKGGATIIVGQVGWNGWLLARFVGCLVQGQVVSWLLSCLVGDYDSNKKENRKCKEPSREEPTNHQQKSRTRTTRTRTNLQNLSFQVSEANLAFKLHVRRCVDHRQHSDGSDNLR